MYRLTNDIARRRQLYPSPLIGTPYILLIDLPSAFRGPGLALGRYYAAFPETELEIAEFDAFLASRRLSPVRPDLLDHRPTQIRSAQVLIIRYEPPAPGWPWMSVCRWPDDLSGVDTDARHEMARGCYTFEAFERKQAMEQHSLALLNSLARAGDLTVRVLAGETVGPPGSA